MAMIYDVTDTRRPLPRLIRRPDQKQMEIEMKIEIEIEIDRNFNDGRRMIVGQENKLICVWQV